MSEKIKFRARKSFLFHGGHGNSCFCVSHICVSPELSDGLRLSVELNSLLAIAKSKKNHKIFIP